MLEDLLFICSSCVRQVCASPVGFWDGLDWRLLVYLQIPYNAKLRGHTFFSGGHFVIRPEIFFFLLFEHISDFFYGFSSFFFLYRHCLSQTIKSGELKFWEKVHRHNVSPVPCTFFLSLFHVNIRYKEINRFFF